MKVDVLLGLQWGDEGKGKVVDVLAKKYDIVARFQGGPNAGHTLEFNGIKHVLHTIPSGVFQENTMNIVGNGVVIDPVVFKKEIQALEKLGVDVVKNLILSARAHLILPTHRMLDAAAEASKGKQKIGSTLKGIGPTYMDKTGRNGLRLGDLLKDDFYDKYDALVKKHKKLLTFYDFSGQLTEEMEKEWFDGIAKIKGFQIMNTENYVNHSLSEKKSILAEGAQGTLLDIEFGTYPYVTSSNTLCSGACSGLGVAPSKIGEVYGIFKAYCTRVGSGPFPTELENEMGQKLREVGHEYGATTGRPRRCGWLDLIALKQAVILNGVTRLIMTKADVLSAVNIIKVCVEYEINGQKTRVFPYDLDNSDLKPIYQEFKSWDRYDLTKMRNCAELPGELIDYVKFIESEVNVPVTLVSVGPDRSQIIAREEVPNPVSF